jgi:hypothetical protein
MKLKLKDQPYQTHTVSPVPKRGFPWVTPTLLQQSYVVGMAPASAAADKKTRNPNLIQDKPMSGRGCAMWDG